MSLHTAYGARASNKHLEIASRVLGNHTTHEFVCKENTFSFGTFQVTQKYKNVKTHCQSWAVTTLHQHPPTPVTPLPPSAQSHVFHVRTCILRALTPRRTPGLLCTGQVLHPPPRHNQTLRSLGRPAVSLNTTELKWTLFIHESACVHWRGRAGCTGW